jgi:uncharacterized membrane protein
MLNEICIFHDNTVYSSLVGVIKTVLIIIGLMVVLRFIGQFMIAKRNMEEEREINKRANEVSKERLYKLKNFGKVKIYKNSNDFKQKRTNSDTEDVPYEEV